MNGSFPHLHVHSYYSLMRGTASPDALCEAAVRSGFRMLALTDTNGLYGLITFLQAARVHGILPIVGASLETEKEKAVLLAKTAKGYEIVSDLITQRHLVKDFSLSRALPESIGHVAFISSDPDLLRNVRGRAERYVEVAPGPGARTALRLAHHLRIPPVATNAVFFPRPDDYSLHRLLRAIDLNRTLSTLPEDETVDPSRWLLPVGNMENLLPYCPEALENAARLAGECRTDWEVGRVVFPRYRDEERDHFVLLEERCREGIRRRYGESNPAVETRLREELDLIRSKGYVDYFLVVADIVRRRSITCGRGSAAASLVSYLLGITHVDPIRHNLFFGRFLNPQRADHPDIDVDFPWDERDGLMEEVTRVYGVERTAMVANHVGFKARGGVREVAKVYGIPAARIKEVTRRLSFYTRAGKIGDRLENHPKFHHFPLDPPWPEIFDLATRLEGIPRYLSVHCGGMVLVPDRVSRYVPVQMAPKGVRVIQWEKDQTEDAGLIKIDLLGNRSLAVIRDGLAAVKRNTGMEIDYAKFNPLDDSATVELIGRGDTMGVFYVESPATRQLQKKARRGDFEHLVIHSSIIRPAANRYIREYVDRLHGAPYDPIHPRLAGLLDETYGIMVYQEDVVKVSMALAGFGWADADGLRKVLSKKSPHRLAEYREQFFNGCGQRGIPPETADKVWDMIISFAGYSFCKPHSASYALVSFKSAWLKVYYPAEFMAAVISNGGGYYTTFAYVSEARRMGLTVLGPDVNESEWHYTGRGNRVRMGFQQLRSARAEVLEEIVGERYRNGPYASLSDFLRRIALFAGDGAVLVKSGSLDSLAGGLNRPQLLWAVEAWCREHPRGREASPLGLVFAPRTTPRVPVLADVPRERILLQEAETLGFVLSVHPLTLADLPRDDRSRPPIAARDLDSWVGRDVRVLGWPITRKEVATMEGEPMEFLSFEDTTDIYEAVLFPDAFRRFCQHLDMNRPYLLSGTVERDRGAVSLAIRQVRRLAMRLPADVGRGAEGTETGMWDEETGAEEKVFV